MGFPKVTANARARVFKPESFDFMPGTTKEQRGSEKCVWFLFVCFCLFSFNPLVVDFFNLVVNILRKVASFLIIYDASFFENCPLSFDFMFFFISRRGETHNMQLMLTTVERQRL